MAVRLAFYRSMLPLSQNCFGVRFVTQKRSRIAYIPYLIPLFCQRRRGLSMILRYGTAQVAFRVYEIRPKWRFALTGGVSQG